MIYSAVAMTADIQKDPSLLSDVRQDKYGSWLYKRNVVAFKGKCKVVVPANDYFGGPNSKTYQSRVLTNPTWGTLFSHARKSQLYTKDTHHMFFEGYYVRRGTEQSGVALLNLSLGS